MKLGKFSRVWQGMVGYFAIASLTGFAVIASTTQPSYAGRSKFYCAVLNGIPYTWVKTVRGDEKFIRWSSNAFNMSPLERCKIVSARFRRYYDNGRFYITGRDNVNGYPVLCIFNRRGGGCSSKNILMTLQKGSDPGFVLQQILDFRRGADGKIIDLT
ncbi:MAG: COP23 domain-containing protein [Nostocaceae cyanobacterium]|nr:COP23 domain-containing protein [Nostocaceae cyanobacterium]